VTDEKLSAKIASTEMYRPTCNMAIIQR